ncbi:MAG: hypothetical protein WA231_03225, partial [Methylocella sp.]
HGTFESETPQFGNPPPIQAKLILLWRKQPSFQRHPLLGPVLALGQHPRWKTGGKFAFGPPPKIPAEFGLKALANRETSGYHPA